LSPHANPATGEYLDLTRLSSIEMQEEFYRALSRIARYRSKEALTRELMKQLADSDRNLLQAEKEKAELLLQNILPAYMIQELKTQGRVSPAHHEDVHVLMTDFCGFSDISRYMSPRELLRELSIYFEAFEEILERYGLEKVKTIGDSMLAVSGIGQKRLTRFLDVILAAIEMQRFTTRRRREKQERGEDAWAMRAAIHCGPVVAGVVGQRKIAFDIWGHTVNIASRIEGAGLPAEITVSEQVYYQIQDFFDCAYFGDHKLKGVGSFNLYTVEGFLPLLREDGGGSVEANEHVETDFTGPAFAWNQRFRRLYGYLARDYHVMRKNGRYHVIKKRDRYGKPAPEQIASEGPESETDEETRQIEAKEVAGARADSSAHEAARATRAATEKTRQR